MMINALRSGIVTLVFLAASPSLSFAVSTLQVVPAGDGAFVVQGIGVEDAAAFDLVVAYDTAGLANPRVAQGPLISGAMTAVNLNVPGTIRMAIIRTTPIAGSGVIATIQFDRKGDTAGKITLFRANLANINGKPIASVVQVQNPPAGTPPSPTAENNPPQQSQNQQEASGAAGQTVTPVVTGIPVMVIPGAVTARTDPAVPAERKEPVRQSENAPDPRAMEPMPQDRPVTARRPDEPSELRKGIDKKMYTQESILERFRQRSGEPTISALTALFEQDSLIGFRQEPRIAPSDGKTAVRITFIFMAKENRSPEVALMSARLLALQRDLENSNTWIAEVLPDRGTASASLAVAQDDMNMVFPLTVTPPAVIDLDGSGTIDEKDFTIFLHQRGTADKVQHDLNGDRKRNYQDEYIFTANYLIKTARPQGAVRMP